MDDKTLYSAIFRRKSIRKYDLTPLTDSTLERINGVVRCLRPLNAQIKTEMKFISQADVQHNFLRIKAPHYLVAFSEKRPGYLTNIGFMLQQLDLFLATEGIGTCWQGIPRPSKEVGAESALEFVIIMSFGLANEPLYRQSSGEFKRKPLSAISNIAGLDDLLEPVRLAPSATNSQPWFFTGDEKLIHAYCVKSNFLKALLYEKMNQIDMGIALYHLHLAAQVAGRTAVFSQHAGAKANPPDGYYYIGSVELQ